MTSFVPLRVRRASGSTTSPSRMLASLEALAVALAVQVAATPRCDAQLVAERPAWKAGDHWNYTVTDTRTGKATSLSRSISKVLDDGGYVLVEEPGRRRRTDANLEYEHRDRPDGKGSWYRWPLRVGERWTFEVPMRMEAGNGTREVKREVAGEERITVPAGTFDCLKVVSDRTQMSYDARAMARPNYSSTSAIVTWYCPAIRAHARETVTWLDGYGALVTTETVLVDYRLGP